MHPEPSSFPQSRRARAVPRLCALAVTALALANSSLALVAATTPYTLHRAATFVDAALTRARTSRMTITVSVNGAISAAVLGGRTQSTVFQVHNTGNADIRAFLSATCSGSAFAGTCTPSLREIVLVPGDSAPVRIDFPTSSSASTGSAAINAIDPVTSGVVASATTSVSVAAAPTAIVTSPTFQRGPNVDKSLCPTFAIAPDVADQCGSFRIAHALPSVTTYGKTYTPTLAFYQDNVRGPYLLVDIARAPGTAVPQQVQVIVYNLDLGFVRQGVYTSRVYPGSAWTGTDPQRVNLGDLGGYSYLKSTYDVEVQFDYGSGWQTVAPVLRGSVVPVIRRQGVAGRDDWPLGNGWGLLGMEELFPRQWGNVVTWVGGDGSTREYVPTPTQLDSVFVTRNLDAPDTLFLMADGSFRSPRPGGVTVWFNNDGRHTSTVDQFGRATTFTYITSPAIRLSTITVPGGLVYTFAYGTSSDTITAPGGRKVILNKNGVTTTEIVDPDGVAVHFSFADWGSAWALTGYQDRRGTFTTLDWAFNSKSLLRSSTTMGGSVPPVEPHFDVSLGRSAWVGTANAASLPDYIYDGPRTDVADSTKLWTDSLGAIVQAVNAVGDTTRIERGDPRFPMLPTRVIASNGFERRASYDSRGHVIAEVAINPYGDGRDAISRYAWNNTWDAITRITGPEGDSTTFGIDPATGLRLWQQDGRGDSTRVNFHYTAGQLDYIQGAGASLSQRTHLTYDGLGNLQTELSPLNGLTTIHRDALGRADTVYTRIDATHTHVHSFDYDLLGRVWRESLFGPSITAGLDSSGAPFTVPATSVTTTSYYSTGGDIDSTTRSPSGGSVTALTTRYRYDALGRVRAVVSPDFTVDSTFYDAAGNDTAHVTRNGDRLSATYDLLNRVLTRVVPAKTLPAHDAKICEQPDCARYPDPYPYYALSAAGARTIAADTSRFDYDPLSGRMTIANNATSQVTRSYFPNGDLQSERQHVRTLSGVIVPNVHDYTLSYRYDLSGRRLGLTIPDSVRPRSSAGVALGSEIQYRYRTDNGALSTITDLLGHMTTAEYNARGERWRTSLPGAVVTDTLDLEGRLISNSALWNEAGRSQQRADAMTYDAQGKLLSMVATAGPPTTMRSWYSGLGQLAHSHSDSRQGLSLDRQFMSEEYLALTGLADITSERTTSNYSFNQYGGFLTDQGSSATTTRKLRLYNPVNGQLQWQYDPARVDTMEYDPAGNTLFSRGLSTTDRSIVMEERASFYDASGRLRVTETRQGYPSQFARVFEESFEDALGRRVLVRTRRFCPHPTDVFDKYCALSTVRRTIWDGSAELAEIQQPATAADMENDGALTTRQDAGAGDAYNPNPFFGTVVYTYGLYGPDRPVSILRLNYVDWTALSAPVKFDTLTVTPLWNALGQMDVGVFPSGSRRDSVGTTFVKLDFPSAWFPYYRERYLAQSWFGTLLQDKADGSGLLYRRNRYYDPSTGRFTQEDPIGLAGGMNLYGFAGGDPVNFADPFGLCPDPKDPTCKYPDDKPLQGPGQLDPVALLAGGVGGGLSASVGTSVATKAVFWSGEGAEAAAAEWASANGGRTLEMTKAGKALASSTKGLDFLSARPQWLKASIKFAEEAAGDVHVFHSAKGVSLGSVWRQEYQALMSNPEVQNIIYHIVH